MDDRQKALIERIVKELSLEGFSEKNIYEKSKDGFGEYLSFVQLLIDYKLEGKTFPTAQEVFENMKKQINYASSTIVGAEQAYKLLSVKVKELEDMIVGKNELISQLQEQVKNKKD